MLGKVNPIMAEFLIQTGFQMIGNHAASSVDLDHSELDLNIWEGCMVFNILTSMELLEYSVTALTQKCLLGLKPIEAANQKHVNSIIPRLTSLAH